MPDASLVVPVFCPVCCGLMKGKSTYSYYNYGCCMDCQIYFLEDRPEKIKAWKEGWRPTKEQIDVMIEAFRS